MPEDYTGYTVNYPHQAAWLVYMNGLEVPVTSVYVDFGVNKIPTCTIEMPPDPRLTRLGFEDRVEVVVFYLDEFFDPDNPQFCLMGEFDLMGWGYSNSGSGRSLRFLCVGTVQIFEMLHMFYMSAIDDIVTAYVAPNATDGSVMTDAMVYYPASLFLQGLMPRRTVATDTEGEEDIVSKEEFITSPYQFIRNIFKALLAPVDVANPDVNKTKDPARMVPQSAASAPGRNFFARYLKRRDVYRRFVGLPYIDDEEGRRKEGCFPIIKAAQSTQALEAVQKQLGASIGPAGSIWEILRMVLNTMCMEIASIPAPTIAMADKEWGVMVDLFEGQRLKGNTFGVIASYCVKPQCYFGLPPACNVIFPSMVQSLSLEEDYTNQPTRVYLGETFLANIINAKAEGNAATITNSMLTTGYPPVVKARMKQYALEAQHNSKNFLIWPEEFFRGPISKHVSAPPWLWMLDKLKDATDGTTYDGTGKGEGKPTKNTPIGKMEKMAAAILKEWCGKLGVPYRFMRARLEAESGFNARNTSSVGAMGLMQIMPITWEDSMPRLQKAGWIPKDVDWQTLDPYDPVYNIMAAIQQVKTSCQTAKISPSVLDNRAALNYSPDAPITDSLVILFYYVHGSDGPTGHKIRRGKIVQGMQKAGKTMGDVQEKYPGESNPRQMLNNMAKFWDKSVAKEAQQSASEEVSSESTETQPVDATEDLGPGTNTEQSAFPTDTPKEPAKMPDTTTNVVIGENGEVTDLQSQTTFVPTPAEEAMKEDVGQTLDPELAAAVQTAEQQTMKDLEALGVLFDKYAQYEYFRARYEARTGAAILAFNPYVVPAFPAAIFDSKYSGVSTIGYVLNVRHTMSAAAGMPSMTTTVNTAFQRTLSEFFGDLRQGWEASIWADFPPPLACFPTEPVGVISDLFQDLLRANDFYGKFFYQKGLNVPLPPNSVEEAAKAEAETEEMVQQESVPDQEESIPLPPQTYYDPEYAVAVTRKDNLKNVKDSASFVCNVQRMVRILEVVDNQPTGKEVPVWEYTDDVMLVPSDEYKEQFRGYDAAMQYVSRPVCTLQQYIELRHGMSIEKAIEAGYVAKEETSFYSILQTGAKKRGAVFWARIYKLRPPTTALLPKDIQKFANCGPAPEFAPIEPFWTMLDQVSLVPDMRTDWDKVLINYRDTVRAEGGDSGAPRR